MSDDIIFIKNIYLLQVLIINKQFIYQGEWKAYHRGVFVLFIAVLRLSISVVFNINMYFTWRLLCSSQELILGRKRWPRILQVYVSIRLCQNCRSILYYHYYQVLVVKHMNFFGTYFTYCFYLMTFLLSFRIGSFDLTYQYR